MISVNITEQASRIVSVTISGHALSNTLGKDLICAAVSSIGTGTLNALVHYSEANYELSLDSQTPLIEINEINQDSVGEIVLKTMLIQLETIQENYPEYIQIHYRR